MWPARPELVSALADRYTLNSVLGTGGTSTVYCGKDEKHDRDVAVKVLHPELAASLTRQRFARETAIAAKLQHPHILPLIDSGAAAGTYYYVMPLVSGVTLRERLGQQPALSMGEVIRILADLADALVCAHAQGVVHRDIKPSNVLLAGRHALLMDFGVAKAILPEPAAPLTVGVALGTPAYMAPEQAMARPDVDHRADLYALGIVGYELLVGRPPFSGPVPRDVLAAHVSQTPERLDTQRPDVPSALNDIVMKCLEKEPADRWPDAATVVDRLDGLTTPSGSTPPVPGPPVQPPLPAWRRPWVTVPVALITVAVGALAFFQRDRDAGPQLRPQQITHVGNAIESAISADGDWLAYVTQESDEQRLYVRDLSSPTALALDSAGELAGLVWSSDGSEIAYHTASRSESTIRTTSRLGGAARTLAPGHGLPSPDMAHIAYVSQADSLVRVYNVAENESVFVKRPSWATWTNRVAWAADSRTLAIEVSGSGYSDFAIALTRDGGPVVEAIRDSVGITAPSFSRDGQFLFFVRQETNQLPDLMRIRLTDDGRPRGDPQLVVQAFEGDPQGGFFESSFPNVITHTTDGDIVYTRTAGESNLATFAIDSTGGPPAQSFLTTGSALYTRVRLSPHEDEVAFLRTTRSGRTVGVMPVTGGTPRSITTSVVQGDVAWSPSGDRLAMTWNGPGLRVGLSIYDFASGVLRRIDVGEISTHLTWLGDDVVVQKSGNRGFLRVDPASEDARELSPDSLGFRFAPRVSADGRRIAFFERSGADSGIWTQDLDSSDGPRLVAAAELTPLGFDQAGDVLYVTDNTLSSREQKRVLALTLETGDLRPMAILPPGFAAEDITSNGRTVIATQIEWRGDVWRLSPSEPLAR